MLRKLALMLAVSPAMWLSQAYALGLGEIDVASQLNQRFSATIPLEDVALSEVETLQVGLASNESYTRSGLDRSDYLSTLKFKVVTDDGAPHITVSSRQIAREPYLNLLVDVLSRSGRIQRQYTILLDPPDYALKEAPPAEAPVEAPAVVPPVAPQKKNPPVAETSAADKSRTYGPVAAGETLWHAATQLRSHSQITMDQMQWALYKANPHAFENGHIGKLLKGVTLQVPAESVIRATSPEAAKRQIEQLRSGKKPAPKPQKPKETSPVVAPAPAEPPPVGAVEPPPVKPTPPVPAPKPAEPVVALKPPPPQAIKPTPAAPETASVPALAAPVASAPVTLTPAEAASAVETSSAVTSGLPLVSETASGPVEAASGVVSETASALPMEPIAPVKPYIPPPLPPEPESSVLMEEWGDAIKYGGGAAVLLGLLGYLLLNRKKQPPAAKGTSAKAASKLKLPEFNWQFWKKKAESLDKPKAAPPTLTAAAPAAFDEAAFEREYAASAKAAPAAAPVAPAPAAAPRKPDLPSNDTVQLPNFDSTQIFDAPLNAPLPAINTDAVDFDVTGKFEAETLKIDLNNNDPLAEADFHLAYGLYDEAALQLKQAAQKEPQRTDIPLKLAEVYFRAGKAPDFQMVAESLKPKLSSADWSKLALMGKQLSPEAALFQGIDADALTSDMDIAFDEPAAVAPQPKPQVEAAPLEFDLAALEVPKIEVPKPAPADAGNTLEFSLDDFKLEAPAPAAAPTSTSGKIEAPMEFDLSSFDLESPAAPAADSKPISVDDIKLDDFDLGSADDSHAISTGDEASTKLDLARAYVDMGDNEMARSLLNEVLQQGSDTQKSEAQTLIGRLG